MRLLDIRDLCVEVDGRRVVDGVSFAVERGEVFGLVGESGSGKTMTALALLGLLPQEAAIDGGSAMFDGADLLQASGMELRALRGARIAMVFQDPSSALNPVMTVGSQLEEAALVHADPTTRPTRRALRGRIRRCLEEAHIKDPDRVCRSYPHQLSGGMKQRAMIAMALMNAPDLLILDEPTTALDVTIQAGILELLREVIGREHLSALFISHDLAVVSGICDRIAVMRAGKIVETGKAADIMAGPTQAYTRELLDSVKRLDLT